MLERSERKCKQRIVAHYLVDNLHTHNIWTIKMFIAEIIYFLNVIGNIYFIDVFLGMVWVQMEILSLIPFLRRRVSYLWDAGSQHN